MQVFDWAPTENMLSKAPYRLDFGASNELSVLRPRHMGRSIQKLLCWIPVSKVQLLGKNLLTPYTSSALLLQLDHLL